MATEALSRGKTNPLPGLRSIMDERGLSGRQVGLICDVHYATVSRVLRGAPASRDTTRRLARGLKVTPQALMSEDGGESKTAELRREIASVEETYLNYLSGGQVLDADYEEDLAALYAKLILADGGTEEAIKEIVLEALRVGKGRGWANAQEEHIQA